MEPNALFPGDALCRLDEPPIERCIRVGPHAEWIVFCKRSGKQVAARSIPADGKFRHNDISEAHRGIKRAHRTDEQAFLAGREPKGKRGIHAHRRADMRFDERDRFAFRGRYIPYHDFRIRHG